MIEPLSILTIIAFAELARVIGWLIVAVAIAALLAFALTAKKEH